MGCPGGIGQMSPAVPTLVVLLSPPWRLAPVPSQNMYCVVTGRKIFTLLPPSNVLFLYEQNFPQGRYRRKADGTGFELEIEEGSLPGIPLGEGRIIDHVPVAVSRKRHIISRGVCRCRQR